METHFEFELLDTGLLVSNIDKLSKKKRKKKKDPAKIVADEILEVEPEIEADDFEKIITPVKEEIIEPPNEEVLQQNLTEQKEEMECLVSMYGNDYGFVSEDAFIIKISSGRFVVRLQITFPKDYPSHASPDPLILGAYWEAFNTEEVLKSLYDLFIPGNTVVYDWTIFIEGYLQDMMDQAAEKEKETLNLKKFATLDFSQSVGAHRLDLETALSHSDLIDTNRWVDSLPFDRRKSLVKVIKKRKDIDIEKLLKKAKKVVKDITSARLYWFLNWISQNSQKMHLPKSTKNPKAVRSELFFDEIEKATCSIIFYDSCSEEIVVIGDKNKERTQILFEFAFFYRFLEPLMRNYKDALSHQSFNPSSPTGYVYNRLKKAVLLNFTSFVTELAEFKECLETFKQDLQHAVNAYERQRSIYKSRELTRYGSKRTVQSFTWGYSSLSTSGKSLEAFFGKNKKKLKRMHEGHMYLSVGNKKAKNGEKRVYHGTPARNANAILKKGLQVNGGKSSPAHGAAFGRGIYTSDSVNIPFSYAGNQPLQCGGQRWLCVFEALASKGTMVRNGIYLVPEARNIRVVGLHLYRT